jgi:metallo-beta-lactamase class B
MRKINTIIFFFLFLAKSFAQVADSPLKISHLTGDFYIYITYGSYNGDKVPANGMYVVTKDGVILFDTPWDTTQFQPLLDSIEIRHHKKVIMCLSTHFHDDRTAGLEYYKHQGIKTYTTAKTDSLCKERGKKRAEYLIYKDTIFNVGQYSFQTYYPGPGHTPDNIVVWFGKEKILYGGCLIKSVEDGDLGYLGDGSPKDYANTIKNVQRKCSSAKFIITGHNSWQDTYSLSHTLIMAERLKKANG